MLYWDVNASQCLIAPTITFLSHWHTFIWPFEATINHTYIHTYKSIVIHRRCSFKNNNTYAWEKEQMVGPLQSCACRVSPQLCRSTKWGKMSVGKSTPMGDTMSARLNTLQVRMLQVQISLRIEYVSGPYIHIKFQVRTFI